MVSRRLCSSISLRPSRKRNSVVSEPVGIRFSPALQHQNQPVFHASCRGTTCATPCSMHLASGRTSPMLEPSRLCIWSPSPRRCLESSGPDHSRNGSATSVRNPLTTVTARIPDAMALSLNPMDGKSPGGLRIRFRSAGSGPCPAPRAEERTPGAERPRIQHGAVAEMHSCGCATPSSDSRRSRRPSCPTRRIRSRSSRSAPSGEWSRRDRHPAG